MILSLAHYDIVEELIRSVHHYTDGHYDIERGLHWIKHSYLSLENNQMLFGSFDGNKLVSVCGLRMHYPEQNLACISNVFYQVKYLNLKQKVKASEEAYKFAFNGGADSVYTALKKDQYNSQWNLVTRYSDFLKKLKIREYQIIKAGELSDQDWINSLLGRMKHSVDYSVREASL